MSSKPRRHPHTHQILPSPNAPRSRVRSSRKSIRDMPTLRRTDTTRPSARWKTAAQPERSKRRTSDAHRRTSRNCRPQVASVRLWRTCGAVEPVAIVVEVVRESLGWQSVYQSTSGVQGSGIRLGWLECNSQGRKSAVRKYKTLGKHSLEKHNALARTLKFISINAIAETSGANYRNRVSEKSTALRFHGELYCGGSEYNFRQRWKLD